MSSLAAAKKRRAPASAPPPPEQTRGGAQPLPGAYQPQGASPGAPPGGPNLTIHQVIELVDKRLTRLEAGAREVDATAPASDLEEHVAASLEETDRRFEMLAEEVDGLKTLLLSLQSYTMDVNKTLLERLECSGGAVPPAAAITGFEMSMGSISL